MNPDTLSLIHEATARRKKTRRETHDEYARTIASIVHRGWSFLGLGRDWFEQRVEEVKAALAP